MSAPRTVTTGQELEALIQENPRAVLELSDGSVCRAERFRSLGEGLWEDELPATVLSPAPTLDRDALDAIRAKAWDEGHRAGMYDGVTAAKIAQTGDLSALPGPTRNPYPPAREGL